MRKLIEEVRANPCARTADVVSVTCEQGYFCNTDAAANTSTLCVPICAHDGHDTCCFDGDARRRCVPTASDVCAVDAPATQAGQYSCRCADGYIDVEGTCRESSSVGLVVGGCVLLIVLAVGVVAVIVASKHVKQKNKIA